MAAAHHISVSYLHRLFQDHETTVSAWIRSQRLERARRDLAEPALRAVPVHRIAARWGFSDHATFTRSFRSAYDIPPKEYRQQHVLRHPARSGRDL
ncbi:helix-turn-helix transcriptional regulator [Streptomyces brasiliensis]|uniref:helix-turn-helix transcriptional regulator n=1 Tax=Streptomyces brasiliensis TaxID=1954 RepID=UPI0027E3C423|nr:helix-turn-helix transcriptional regulator [Streptomyces brasiliensis]